MSKKLASFILIFLVWSVSAQELSVNAKLKSNRSFYTGLYFDILGLNIPKNDLQKLLLLESSYGDSQHIKQLVIYNLLFGNPDTKNDISCEKDRLIIEKINSRNLLVPPQKKGLRESLLNLLGFYIGNQIKTSNCLPEDFISCFDETLVKLADQNQEVSKILINELEPICGNIIEEFNKDTGFVFFLAEYYTTKYLEAKKIGLNPEIFYQQFENSMNTISPVYKYLFFCHEPCFTSNNLGFQLKLQADINETILKLFNREASEAEKKFYEQIVLKEPDGLKMVYYLLLTSNEYMYY